MAGAPWGSARPDAGQKQVLDQGAVYQTGHWCAGATKGPMGPGHCRDGRNPDTAGRGDLEMLASRRLGCLLLELPQRFLGVGLVLVGDGADHVAVKVEPILEFQQTGEVFRP